MVDILSRRVQAAGVANVHPQVADTCHLPNEFTAKFDVIFSNLSFMFIPDKLRAFQEIRRCLKPGGLAAITVWGPLRDNTFMSCMRNAVDTAETKRLQRNGEPTEAGVDHWTGLKVNLSLQAANDIRTLMKDAGLATRCVCLIVFFDATRPL